MADRRHPEIKHCPNCGQCLTHIRIGTGMMFVDCVACRVTWDCYTPKRKSDFEEGEDHV
jgi:hypothetical protein